MLSPGARPAIHRAMTGQTDRASTHRAGVAGRAVRRRLGSRWLTGFVALASAIALPLAAAGPASADQARQRQQWVLSALNVPSAWQVTQGKGVTVAVIDSGVDPSVSDLTGSVRSGPDYTGVHTSPSNPNWGLHGTWMASLIAGHGHGRGNGDGILGVAPKSKVLSIRVITDASDPGYHAYRAEPAWRGQHELAKAINYAVRRGAGVISMSLGYAGASRVVRSALQTALAHNVVVVASSGNAGESHTAGHGNAPYSFPADYPGVIGVAAVTQSGQAAYFSSENLSVQVAAPGVNVPAQGRGSKYWVVSGTSPACALTAGVAALIKSRFPKLTAAQVRSAITGSSANRPRGGYDDHVGFGTVDAAAALKLAGGLAKQVPAGQTRAGHAAAGGNFGGGEAGVPAFPIRPQGRQKLLVFGGIAAGGVLLLIVAMWLLASSRRRRRAATRSGPIGVTATQGPLGPVAKVGPIGQAGPGHPLLPAAPRTAPGPVGAGGTDLDVRYPTQIYPARPGLPVQGYISQPGEGLPVQGFLGQQAQTQLGPGQRFAGQGFPGQAAPGQWPPGHGVQGQGFPGQGFPGQATPGQAPPGQWTAGQRFPDHGFPGQGFQGQDFPGQAASGHAAPGQTAHQWAPGQGVPAQGSPGQGVAGPGAAPRAWPGQPDQADGQPRQPGQAAGQAGQPGFTSFDQAAPLQHGPGQYGHGQPGQPHSPAGPAEPGQFSRPGSSGASGQFGHPGHPGSFGASGQPGRPAPFDQAGQVGRSALGADAPVPGPQGYAGPGQGGHGYMDPGYAGPGFAEFSQPSPGYSTPPPAGHWYASAGSAGPANGTIDPFPAPPATVGQGDSSDSEWPFEDEPSSPDAPPAATAITGAPADPAQPVPSGQNESHAWPGARPLAMPGRTILPEPDAAGLPDEDPLTSPRYSWDGRAERALRPGNRPGWLSSTQGVTRPMASPGGSGQLEQAGPSPLPKRSRQPVQAEEMSQPDQARLADSAPPETAAAQSAPGMQRETTRWPVAQPGGPAPGEPAAPQPAVPGQAGPAQAVPAQDVPTHDGPTQPGPAHAGPATVASPSSAASANRQHVFPTRSPGSESAAAAGASGQSDQPATRSVWEPLATDLSKPSGESGAPETVQYAGPSIKTGPSAWQTWASRQPASFRQDDAAAGSAKAPAATAAGAETVRDPTASDRTPTGSEHGQASPRRAESASGPASQASFGAALPRRQSQQGTDGLPKRQPMTHLAAPLRRDRPSAGPQQQASDGPLPSVWDTWRPTAAAKRAGQQDGSDTGDDQT